MKKTATRNRSFGKLCGLVAAGGAMTCAMFALGVVFAEPAHADVTEVYVGGDTRNIADGGTIDGASFDKATQTLTLDNVDLTNKSEAGWPAKGAVVIRGGKFDEVTVKLEGRNTFEAASSSANGWQGIYANCKLKLEGPGSLSANGFTWDVIHTEEDLTVDSGNYDFTSLDTLASGFYADGNMTIKGGDINVESNGDALYAQGHVKVKGGSLSLHGGYYALRAGSASTNPDALVDIDGALAPGCSFNSGESTYRVTSMDPLANNGTAVLTRYRSAKKKTKVGPVYCGLNYSVSGIAKGAFENSKVSSVTIGDGVETIGSRAFCNCKQLKTLKFESDRFLDASTIGSRAFKGAGAKKGKGLTVKIGWKPWNKAQTRAEFRTVLRHKGLSAKATVR